MKGRLLPCTVTDDAGNQLTLTQPARRIVALAPDLTELIYALDAGPTLVGVMKGSDYPEAAKSIIRVGDYRALDVEAILALHPDLILAWGESQTRQVEILKKFAIPVFISHPQHLRDIPSSLRRLGCLTGKQKEANQLSQAFSQRYSRLEKKYRRAGPIRVFYQLAQQPLMTVNQASWINDAIQLCGGRNIFAQIGLSGPFKQTAFAVSAEAVLKANPELIVAGLSPGWQQSWQTWPSLAAVKEQHLMTINPDLLERPGPRILDGVEKLCQIMTRV